jgi:hypothetical protein
MTKDEALKMALETLERSVSTCFTPFAYEEVMCRRHHFVNETITAIKEALAQPEQEEIKGVVMRCADYDIALPVIDIREGRVLVGQVSITPKPKEPEQEPVAWMDKDGDVLSASVIDGNGLRNIPLYTIPPQRTWVGLTGTEINHIIAANVGYLERMVKEVENLLREKNT